MFASIYRQFKRLKLPDKLLLSYTAARSVTIDKRRGYQLLVEMQEYLRIHNPESPFIKIIPKYKPKRIGKISFLSALKVLVFLREQGALDFLKALHVSLSTGIDIRDFQKLTGDIIDAHGVKLQLTGPTLEAILGFQKKDWDRFLNENLKLCKTTFKLFKVNLNSFKGGGISNVATQISPLNFAAYMGWLAADRRQDNLKRRAFSKQEQRFLGLNPSFVIMSENYRYCQPAQYFVDKFSSYGF